MSFVAQSDGPQDTAYLTKTTATRLLGASFELVRTMPGWGPLPDGS